MTDKTPKLLVDALGAIALAQEFVASSTATTLPSLKQALSDLLYERG